MNTFGITQTTISHTIKNPHSKALEPDCLCPRIAMMTQSPRGEGSPACRQAGERVMALYLLRLY
jgi:hypothetical protein